MVKVVVKQPGFFISIPTVGAFRSPFKIVLPESMRTLITTQLMAAGVKDFKISSKESTEEKVEKKVVEKIIEKDSEVVEDKQTVDLSEVYKRLDTLQNLVTRMLDKGTIIREVVIQKGESGSVITKQPEVEEEIFIPRPSEKISIIDLNVKTSEKGDISDQVDLLTNLKK